MKIKALFLILLFSLFFSFTAHAEVAIKAEVDKIAMSTDDVLTYKIIVTSAERITVPVQFPKFEGFLVLSNAQSQTVSFVKGGIRSIVVYAFVLKPKGPGKIKIEPSSIKFQDKNYTSDHFEINVKQGKIQPKAPVKKEIPARPEQIPLESNAPQYNL